MPDNSTAGQSILIVFLVTLAAALIAGFILWLLPSKWRTRIHSLFRRAARWSRNSLSRSSKETPEQAEERHQRELLESDDPDIWKPLP